MPTVKPSKLKRKRCLNCNKLFQPKKPWSKFCKDECRKEFHRHGSAFGPMKLGLYAAIDKKVAQLKKEWAGEARRLRVEVETLHAEAKGLRGQIEKQASHTHEYDRADIENWWTARTGEPV